ncbi:MAG: hypothetical protein COA47_09625 [Robiginitomaculum sp.]|nr:MAG: hypothetical protein COA47_09625 [Robiginitomaculum sp.]
MSESAAIRHWPDDPIADTKIKHGGAWIKSMIVRKIGLVLACAGLLGACTTISTGPQALQGVEQKQNFPIKMMADNLVTRFTARGWVIKTDRTKQVKKLAGFLMRGFGKTDVVNEADPVDTYLATLWTSNPKSGSTEKQVVRELLLAEISLASSEVGALNQQVEAAASQVKSSRILRVEMLSLEQALLATRKAKKLFENASKRAEVDGDSVQTSLGTFSAQIEYLTRQTNSLNQWRQSALSG